jgi:probable rRNA maturation factor
MQAKAAKRCMYRLKGKVPQSPIRIAVQNRQRAVAIRTATVKRRVQQIMLYLGCADKELSVVFASDQLMRTLNRVYRSQDRPTNVLAFPQLPASYSGPAAAVLGDVVVSLPVAVREAHALQQSLEDRVTYLLLHGILHLLGYDHEQSTAKRRRMEALEEEVLQHLHGHQQHQL